MFKATHGSEPAEPWFKAGPGCDSVPGVHSEACAHHSKNLQKLWFSIHLVGMHITIADDRVFIFFLYHDCVLQTEYCWEIC